MKRVGYHLTQAECDRLKRLCETYSYKDAAMILGCHICTVYQVRDRGWKSFAKAIQRRPIPSDFALNMDRMTLAELCRHYRAGSRTVARWASMKGRAHRPVKPKRHPRLIDPPADLAKVVAEKGVRGACRHYGFHPSLLYRMRLRAGIPINSKRKPQNDNGPGWVERYIEQRRSA